MPFLFFRRALTVLVMVFSVGLLSACGCGPLGLNYCGGYGGHGYGGHQHGPYGGFGGGPGR